MVTDWNTVATTGIQVEEMSIKAERRLDKRDLALAFRMEVRPSRVTLILSTMPAWQLDGSVGNCLYNYV